MNRKEIIRALEEKWGVKAKYLGAPTFAYEVGGCRIDRNGAVTGMDNLDEEIPAFEELRMTEGEELGLGKSRREDFQGENGMRADDCPETGEPETAQPETAQQGYAFPLEGHTVLSLRNLVNMLASKQALISASFGLEKPFIERELAEELDQIPIENVDAFVAVWLNLARGRAPGLKLDLATHTLILQLPKENPTLEEMTAFRDLTIGIDESAKKLKHSSLKPAQEENPKFAFRTWLIRLGMNGDEFKGTRKVLLAKLAGNSSFRSPKPAAASSGERA